MTGEHRKHVGVRWPADAPARNEEGDREDDRRHAVRPTALALGLEANSTTNGTEFINDSIQSKWGRMSSPAVVAVQGRVKSAERKNLILPANSRKFAHPRVISLAR